MIRLDTETADVDLDPGPTTVLTHTLPAAPTEHLVGALLLVGAGAKLLSGTGTMTVTLTAGGLQVFSSAVAIAGTAQYFSIPPLPLPGGAAMVIQLASSNTADDDITVTACLDSHDEQYALALENANVWFVAKTGDDGNDGHSLARAKLTIGAAVTAASSGDRIVIHPGTYDENVDLATPAKTLTVEGTNRKDCIIQPSAGGIALKLYSGSVARNLSAISQVHNGTNCCGINMASQIRCRIEDCYAEGSATSGAGIDGVVNGGGTQNVIVDSFVFSSWDAIQATGGDLRIENTIAWSDGTDADEGAENRGILASALTSDKNRRIVLRNSTFIATRSISHPAGAVAAKLHARVHVAGCSFLAYTGGGCTGNARGVYFVTNDDYMGAVPLVQDCHIVAKAEGGGTAYDLSGATGGSVNLRNTGYATIDAVLVVKREVAGGASGPIVGDITGSLSGSVGSVTGNVTGSVASVTGNVTGSVGSVAGNVTGSVGSVAGNVSGSVASVTGNVTGSLGSLGATALSGVLAQIASALTTYDGPTDAELDAARATIMARLALLGGAHLAMVDALKRYTTQGTAVQNLSVAQHEAASFQFDLVDGMGEAVDLTAHVLQFVVTGGAADLVKGNGEGETGLTILSPATAGQVVVTLTEADTATAMEYAYELWDLTGGDLLYSRGKLTVKSAHGPAD